MHIEIYCNSMKCSLLALVLFSCCNCVVFCCCCGCCCLNRNNSFLALKELQRKMKLTMRNNWLIILVILHMYQEKIEKNSQLIFYWERLLQVFAILRLIVCYTLSKVSTSTSVKLKIYLVTALKLLFKYFLLH